MGRDVDQPVVPPERSTCVFFDNFYGLLRVVVASVCAYAALVAMLRVSGARNIAQMNAFDFVVTVALGSTLATIILTDSVAIVEGIVALAMLILLQFSVTWLSVRSKTVSNLVKSTPVLVVYRGQLLSQNMWRSRVIEEEIQSALRQNGMASVEAVEAVILETDGKFSVIPRLDEGDSRSAISELSRHQDG